MPRPSYLFYTECTRFKIKCLYPREVKEGERVGVWVGGASTTPLPTGGKGNGLWVGGALIHTPLHWWERGGALSGTQTSPQKGKGWVPGWHFHPHHLPPSTRGNGKGLWVGNAPSRPSPSVGGRC